jgi:hypothetical protein
MEPKPNINIATQTFIGKYITDISSEPLYSYRIYVKEIESNSIVQDSGNILHNNDNTEIYNDNGVTKY